MQFLLSVSSDSHKSHRIRRVERQLRAVAVQLRTSQQEDPDGYDIREPLWIKHFNLLKELDTE